MMKFSLVQTTLIFILLVSFTPTLVQAESKTFIREYSYQASEYDSKLSCRTLALEQVKRLLLEELGTYLESETEVKNYKLTKDQVKTYTAGIVQTKIISEKWNTENLKYWLKASIIADPQDVVNKVNSLRKDLQKTRELEETRKKVEELSAEIERLKIALDKDITNTKLIAQYMKAIEGITFIEMFRKGTELSISGKLPEAINELNDAILKNPRYALAYTIRAHLYTKLGKNGAALEDASKAIKLDPNSAFAYVGRAYIYYRMHESEKGLIDADKAIQLDPTYSYAYILRGIHLEQMGDYQKALEDGEKAVELSPNNAHSYLIRSDIHSRLGNKLQADWDLKRAVDLDPNSAEVYIVRATYAKSQGNYNSEALDYLNKAIEIDPYHIVAYFNRADIYIKNKEYKQAVADYSRAIDIAPKYLFYAHRGFAYNNLRQYQSAIEDCNEAIRQKPDYVVAYIVRGSAYLSQGDNNLLGCFDAQKACDLGDCKLLERAKGKRVCR
jgi:tetratricopeptide (TPR) repeat protein